MLFQPIYEATVYAPRSVDATETTVLTPASGAPHSDPFVLTTQQGISGTKPYLDWPTNRAASIDPLNKTITSGTITLKLLDFRTTPGGTNAERWVSAFIGDGKGGNMLLGRLVKVRESLDNGGTYTTYATGRITACSLQGKLAIQITIRDRSDDLDVDIFIGAPASSVSGYANLAQVAPVGLLHPYGNFPTTTPLKGVTRTKVGNFCFVDVDKRDGDTKRTILTQAMLSTSLRAMATGKSTSGLPTTVQPPKIFMGTSPTGPFSEYDLGFTYIDVSGSRTRSTSLESLVAVETQKSGAATLPTAGTTVYFYVVDPQSTPSDATPLLINDVSFTTYLADLCAGKFGRLDATTGNPVRSVPFDANGVDGSKFLPWRRPVTEASKLRTEIEAICKAYPVACYLKPDGTVTLVDLRRSSITSVSATLTDADLSEEGSNLTWTQSRDEAVTALLGTYYTERQITDDELPTPFKAVLRTDAFPDISSVRVQDVAPQQVLIPDVTARSGDMKPQTLKLDVKGFRVIPDANRGERIGSQLRVDAIVSHFEDYKGEVAGPFGLGPSYVEVTCRRASANASAISPGKWAALTLTALPDPATNRRGGTRLALCLSRTDDGPRTKLKFLDGGANSAALPPTIGAPTGSGTAQANSLSFSVTTNANADLVRVAYAITAPSVGTRPADDDPSWVSGEPMTGSGTASVDNLPSGKRVWIRGRSEPRGGTGFKLPSSYAYPSSGTGYLDTPTMTAPSSVSVSTPHVNETVASWTNGESWPTVEALLVTGTAPGSWSDSNIIQVLLPGSTRAPIYGLIPSTQYTVGIRHRDIVGGTSTVATATFTTGAAVTLPVPNDPTPFAGVQDPRLGVATVDGLYGLGVVATVFPSYIEFAEEVETGIGAGSYGTQVSVGVVPAAQYGWTICQRSAPNDGLRRRLAAREVRASDTSSSFADAQTVMPWTQLALPITPPSRDTGAGQGTVSVDPISGNTSAQGAVSFTYDLPATALSMRYLVGTSTQPSDASTLSSGSIVNGRTGAQASVTTINLGQVPLVTIIPFTGLNATGTALPSFHLRGSFQSFKKTKVATFGGLSWGPQNFGVPTSDGLANLALGSNGGNPNTVSIPSVGLPTGVTLEYVDFDVTWNSATNRLSDVGFAVRFASGGSSIFNTGYATYAGGAQTVRVTMTSPIDAGSPVVLQGFWFGLGPPDSDAGQANLRDVRVTYTQNDLSTTI